MAVMESRHAKAAFGNRLLNIKLLARVFLAIFVSFVAMVLVPVDAQAAECPSSFTAGGYFFQGYESVEYSPEGYPIQHLKVNYLDGRPFRFLWSYFDDECNSASATGNQVTLSLPAGVSDWSARVVSPTRIEVWNDQNNTVIAGFDIPAYPAYTSIAFGGTIDGSASTFGTRKLKMTQNAEPPVFTSTLPKPEACASVADGSVGGGNSYFFDAYEYAEYVGGFLRVHLRLKTPYNDGRPFRSAISTGDENCFISSGAFSPVSTSITQRVRYFSFRMTSDTHWQLWDDEADEALTCATCEGELPPGAKYVRWFGSVDAGASTISTTPFAPTESVELDPVIVVPGILGSMQKDGVWILDPILHVYDNLVETLDANEYTLGVDLFIFPYDWTKSNVETALLLKTKIDEVKAICSCNKVDIVAHSMGGLVTRQYVQSASYENDIDQLIFLGTPHMGAPKAYLMYEGGENGPGVQNALTHLYLSHLAHEAGYENAFDYIRLKPIPSVRELLPVYSYLFNDSSSLWVYPNSYPTNPFLENLTSGLALLTSSGIEVTNIIGENLSTDTINSITVKDSTTLPLWQHGVPIALNNGQGDGTVPYSSANSIGTSIKINSSHSKLPTLGQSLVYEELTTKLPEVLINDNLFDNALVVRAFSPIDFQVIAPDGRRVGRNFSSLGNEINEIPGAFYTGINTDAEFVVIPNPTDGEYKIATEGTGSGGAYTISTAYVTETETKLAEFDGVAVPAVQKETKLILDSNNDNPVSVVDTTPPTVQIISPENGSLHLHGDQLTMMSDVQDSESGVADVVTRFDGEVISGEAVDLFFKTLGTHTIQVDAIDISGNAASASSTIQVIATFESTIADVERAHELGWIMKKSSKNSLLNKLEKAVKVRKRIEFLEEKLPGQPKVIKRIEKLEKRLDRVLGQKIIEEIEKDFGKGLITKAGYLLIKADVEWLLSSS
jgi:pimeloyl-ACP methyl ester carboxylesterase